MSYYPRVEIKHHTLRFNQRVYVKDLDVFGRVRARNTKWIVVCEAPMAGYEYEVELDSVLYNEAIGDRDPEDAMPINDPNADSKEGKALIFVSEESHGYNARILAGIGSVVKEVKDANSDDESDHPGMEATYPRRRGLHVWEGEMVFGGEHGELPSWKGEWRNMEPQDFKAFDV